MLYIALLIYASVLLSRSQGRPLQEHHSHNTSSAVRDEIPFTSYFGNSAISEELWTEYGGKHSKGSILEYNKAAPSAFNGQNLGGKYRGTWRVAPVMLLDPQKQNEGGLGNVSTGEELIEGADLAGQTLDPRAELAGQKHTNGVRGGIMVQRRQAAVSSSAPMSMLNDGGYMLLSLKSRDTTSRGVVKEVVGELILHDGFHLSAESVVHMELSGLWTQHPDPSNNDDPDVLADTPDKSVARRKRGSATSAPPYIPSSTFSSDSSDAVTSVKTHSSSNSLAAGKGGNKQQPRTAGHLLALLKYKPSNREARDLQSQGKSAKPRPFWGPLSYSASSTSSSLSHPAAGDDATQILPALSEESSAAASSAAPAARADAAAPAARADAAAPAARADAAAPAADPAEAGTPSPLLLSSKFDTIVESAAAAAAAAAASNQDPLSEDSPQGFGEHKKSVADDVDVTALPPPLAAGIVALTLATERRSLQGLLAADTGSSSSTWHHDYRAALRSAGWKLAAGTLQIPWGSREETRAAGVHPKGSAGVHPKGSAGVHPNKGSATGSASAHGSSSSQQSRMAAASPDGAAAVWSRSSRHDSREVMKSPAFSTSLSSSSRTRWWPWKRGHTSDGGSTATSSAELLAAGHLQTGTATSTAAATADGPPGATGAPLGRNNNQKQRQASSSLGSVSAWLVEMLHMEVECEVWMDVWIQEGQILESAKMAHVDGLSSISYGGGGQYDQDSWSASVDNVLLTDEAVLPPIKAHDMAAGIGITSSRANVESSDGDEGGRGWRGLPGTNDMQMVGTIRSSNCGGSVLILQGGGVDIDSVISHFYYYVYYMVFITLSQGVGQIAQMIHTGENTEALSRLSSMSLRMHAVQDNFMCLVHLLIGLTVDDLFWPCMGLCILQFVEFGVLQVQYILLVWRAQQPSSDMQRNREDMHNQQASHYVDLIFLCILVAAFVADSAADSAPAPHSVISGDLSNMHQDHNPPLGIIVNSSDKYDYTSLLSPPEVPLTSGTSSGRAWQYSPVLMLGGLPALIQACPLLLLIPLTSVWVPQILKCIATESRPPFLFTYVLWSSLGRLAVPLYLLVVPWGLQQSRSWLLAQACVLIVWMVMQVLALDCLRRYGPRRLLPAFLLPKRYDYHRPATAQELGSRAIQPASTSSTIRQTTVLLAGDQQQPSTSLSRLPGVLAALAAGGSSRGTANATIPLLGVAAPVLAPAATAGGASSSTRDSIVPADIEEGRAPHYSSTSTDAALAAECVICMCPVPLAPEANRLLTPCGHFFHEPCLRRWSEVKLECPYCRQRLPPLHEPEDHGAGDGQGGSSHLDEDAEASNNNVDGGTTFMNQLMNRLMGRQLMQRRRQHTSATTTRRVMLGP